MSMTSHCFGNKIQIPQMSAWQPPLPLVSIHHHLDLPMLPPLGLIVSLSRKLWGGPSGPEEADRSSSVERALSLVWSGQEASGRNLVSQHLPWSLGPAGVCPAALGRGIHPGHSVPPHHC